MAIVSRPDIKNWIETIPEGVFHYKDIMGLRSVLTPEQDTNLRKVMYDFCHQMKPICESLGRGNYRLIDELPEPEEKENKDRRCDGVQCPLRYAEVEPIRQNLRIRCGGWKVLWQRSPWRVSKADHGYNILFAALQQ